MTPSDTMRKNLTLRETLDLRTWLDRCHAAGVPFVPAQICPFLVKTEDVGNKTALQAISNWTQAALAIAPSKSMWRWNVCAPIEIKAAMSHPWLPVRLLLPIDAGDDGRLQAIAEDRQEAGITHLTALVRPWIESSMEENFPVEFRVFVTKSGTTSTTSYYTQRPLPDRWLRAAKQATAYAKMLRPHVNKEVEFSADFLVTSRSPVPRRRTHPEVRGRSVPLPARSSLRR